MRILLSLLCAPALMLTAAAANDTMDAMTGKAVTYAYADGTMVTAYYSEDGTYTTDGAGSGAWSMDGDELCITTASGESGCTMLEPGHGSGDSWQGVDAFGNDVTISIE